MLLLEKVFQIINESGLQYCIQNKYEMMPKEIPSDIDMMYKDASEEFLDNLVKKIADETGLIITQKICQGYFEYTYIISYPTPKKYFQLQLDFYRAISRRHYLNIMPAEEMLNTRRFYRCFYVPDQYIELKYMWIRRTIKHDLDEGHISIAKELYALNPIQYKKNLTQDFGERLTDIILEILKTNDKKLFYSNFKLFDSKAKEISRRNATLLVRLKYAWFMLKTVIPKRVFHKCGMSVAMISPDGGGKSTIIERVRGSVGGSFYGDKVLYFRPRLLKNAGHYNVLNRTEEAASNPDPHGVELDGKMKSLARFLFYNLDFLFGMWIKVGKMKIGKQIVFFDRYYYDYLVDLKRYKYDIPRWLPKVFLFLIPKPDMIFILDGSPKYLYERKKELTIAELEQQCRKYRAIPNTIKSAILINVERDIDEIVDEITTRIIAESERRTKKLMKNTREVR